MSRQVVSQFSGSQLLKSVNKNTERDGESSRVAKEFFSSVVFSGKSYEVHPLAERFEMLGDEEFAVLKESVRVSGQMTPIIIDGDGKVIDGRNRLKAFLELKAEGTQPATSTPFAQVVLGLTDTEIAVVITDANINRRHLTPVDRLRIAKELRGGDKRTPKQVSQAKRDAKRDDKSVGTESNDLVTTPVEEKIALRQEVATALEVSDSTAQRNIKRAADALDMTIESGHRYTRTEADEVLGYLADNPKAAPKPKPKVVEVEKEVKEDMTKAELISALDDIIYSLNKPELIKLYNVATTLEGK